MAEADRATAFILMPFGEDFDPVYEKFIKPALDEAGLVAIRADDIRSQRNILQDIVEAIEQSHLIVADLTDSNPNVFYELGLAHALERPVILLTQTLEDVPFDLQSYRLVRYDVHFAKIDGARRELSEYAKGFLEGNVRFSSPVSDFRVGLARAGEPDDVRGSAIDRPDEEDDRGLLDHMELIEDGYGRLMGIIEQVTELTNTMGERTNEATDQINRVRQNRQNIPYAYLRRISDQLSMSLDAFTKEMTQLNTEYTNVAREVDDSLEFIVTYPGAASSENRNNIAQLLDTLEKVRGQGEESIRSYRGLAATMDDLPPFEKNLARTTRRASQEVRKMADNMEMTLSSINRALSAGLDILSQEPTDAEAPSTANGG